jgi:hypothetical protein
MDAAQVTIGKAIRIQGSQREGVIVAPGFSGGYPYQVVLSEQSHVWVLLSGAKRAITMRLDCLEAQL